MQNKRIFESVFGSTGKLGLKFSEFKQVLERTDFSDVDNKKLNDMLLWGDRSTLLNQNKSLMQALNIDVEDETLMPKIGSIIPAYTGLFDKGMEKSAKAIDLINAQVEYIKSSISSFENKFVSSLTGKEVGKEFKSDMLGIRGIAGETNITQELVDKVAQVFSTATSAPLKPSIDQFVESEEGKKLVSILEEIGANTGSSGTMRVINDVISKAVKTVANANIDVAINAADNTDLEEITGENVILGEDLDYVTQENGLSEMELMSSMDPFVRLGMFYQLALLQNDEFSDRVVPSSSGTGVNYNGMMAPGRMNAESLKILFGRRTKTDAIQDVLKKLDSISLEMLDLKWSGPDGDEARAALFTPAMQVVYVALLNYVIMKGLYAYLTKKTVLVAKGRAEQEEAAKKAVVKTPATMTKNERGRKIQEIYRSSKLKDLLDDDTIYIANRKGYDPDRVKVLKELVYYMFGNEKSDIESVKNWDVTKYPIDGNYDAIFAGMIKDIQREYSIRPIDGKVGPITKAWFSKEIPLALADML